MGDRTAGKASGFGMAAGSTVRQHHAKEAVHMTKSRTILNLTLLTAGVLFVPALHAQRGMNACTNAVAAGTYSVTCSGWTAAGPAGALVPIMQVGVAAADPDGNWSGTTVINIGGQMVIPAAKVSGTTAVQPDCTGAITYNKGTPGELNISYVMNPSTNEIHGLVTDKGTVAACVLKRISK